MVLQRGSAVEVFYCAWADSDGDQRVEWHAGLAASNHSHGSYQASNAAAADDAASMLRLTAGWVAATVLEDCRPAGVEQVVIRYDNRQWFNAYAE